MKKCLTVLTVFVLSGCFGGSDEDQWTKDRLETYPVNGSITLDGEPLADATIVFRSNDQDVSASGTSDAEGRFSLTTYEDGDGAVEGTHAVMVQKYDPSTLPENVNLDEVTEVPEPELLIPEKYSSFETSELSATITAGEENKVEIPLQSE